jgi:hypothetical protein
MSITDINFSAVHMLNTYNVVEQSSPFTAMYHVERHIICATVEYSDIVHMSNFYKYNVYGIPIDDEAINYWIKIYKVPKQRAEILYLYLISKREIFDHELFLVSKAWKSYLMKR